MRNETAIVIDLEQREYLAPVATPIPASVQARAPRGRPWVKGQSGNPAGRPRLAQAAAAVTHLLIDRKAVALTRRLIDLALAGDRTALRLCFDRITPPRREAPSLPPPAENSGDIDLAVETVAEAAARGIITAAQSEALTQMLRSAYFGL